MVNASVCTVELWIHLEDVLEGLLSSQELEVNPPRASSALSCAQVTFLGCHCVFPSHALSAESAVESVDEGTKGRVSELLSEASRLLFSSTSSKAALNSTRPAAIPQATINETLKRAQGCRSSSTGLCRGLNRQERLRAAAGTSYKRTRQAESTTKNQKKYLGICPSLLL